MSSPSLNTTPARDALAWATQEPGPQPAEKSVWEWFWEAIQGDFNEERSTGQITMDAAISMIPLVDQLCDIRDLVANCRKISNEPKDTWAWFALALTLIGLFPSLGSLVKGVLKIVFLFVRKHGADKAIDLAMTWVVTFLRRRDVQAYLKVLKVDEVFGWLAKEVRAVASLVNPGALLTAFDKGINLLKGWAAKVEYLPRMGARAKKSLEMLQAIRRQADAALGPAVKPLQQLLDNLALRLERESLLARKGVVDAHNVHFRGTLPQAHAVTLMREAEPPPGWLSKGVKANGEDAEDFFNLPVYRKPIEAGWPPLTPDNIRSFKAGTLVADEIKGPARLYRVVSPSSGGMSDCWMSKAEFDKINAHPDPRTYWRKFLAVWPHWNSDGQFVIYDIPAGDSLKFWRGTTSAQSMKELDGRYLEGGDEQIIFKLKKEEAAFADTMGYYRVSEAPRGAGGTLKMERITKEQSDELRRTSPERTASVREKINHPNISGPFETGWFATDYDAALPGRIGLPALPGQTTQLASPPKPRDRTGATK